MGIQAVVALTLALVAFAFSARATSTDSMVSCTAKRLSQFVGPLGIQQAWPVTSELPALSFNDPGVLLSGSEQVMDGYTQHLHVNADTRSAYVIQQGGIAGKRTVFGPLPVSACSVTERPERPITPRSPG